jgi:hypothetical protein
MELFLPSHIDGNKFALMLTILLLIPTVAVSVLFVGFSGDHTVEFVSVVDNENGTQTWTYRVMNTGSRAHWTIAWGGGANSIVGASHDYMYGKDLGGLAGTGLHAIQFGMETASKGNLATYWFTLDEVYKMGTVGIGTNYDPLRRGDHRLDTITGPVVTYELTLKMEGEGIDSTYMVAVAETDCVLVHSVMFSWFGPFESKSEAGPYETGLGSPVWEDVDDVRLDGFVSQHKVVEDYLGCWYVVAVFEGGTHPGEASGTLDLFVIIHSIPS